MLRSGIRVAVWAASARCIVLGVSCACAVLLPSYDKSDDDNRDCVVPESATEQWLHTSLRGLGHWDGVFFREIALHGYHHEQFFAFFPLYPWLVRGLAGAFSCLSECLSVLVAGVLLSNLSFILSCVVLHALLIQMEADRSIVLLASLLYTINPASIFMSACYSESIFALCTFAGVLCFLKKKCFLGCLCFMLAATARANGILLAAFPLVNMLVRVARSPRAASFSLYLSAAVEGAAQIAVVAVPMVVFQAGAHNAFCRGGSDPTPDTEMPSWCRSSLPLIYPYVQSKYWNIGLLHYFTLPQIPNFVLASPMVAVAGLVICDQTRRLQTPSWPDAEKMQGLWTAEFVMTLLLGAMTLLAVLAMHVQVVTRFICSSSPVLYLGVARWAGRRANSRKFLYDCAVIYFVTYALVGSVLFSLFYPWT
eukprot:m.202430 g.202430  ORF g.202430 m.202430 type:complete len:423 (+) comp21955_c1_seq3:2269-3537(+)